ncbi:MAG: hypothetical protein ACO1OF_16445 [Adhaeribacter sp.]
MKATSDSTKYSIQFVGTFDHLLYNLNRNPKYKSALFPDKFTTQAGTYNASGTGIELSIFLRD